jgi:hypothetical protein
VIWVVEWLRLALSEEHKCLPPLTCRRKQIQFLKCCASILRIPDYGQSPETERFWVKRSCLDIETVLTRLGPWFNQYEYEEQCKGHKKNKRTDSMVWVRERTIPTERPPLVGEVIANFCGQRVPRDQRDGSLRPYSRVSRQEPLLFYQVAPQLYPRGWVNPVPDPLFFFSW